MIDARQIGKLIAEEIVNEPGPCFYPGKFKPPHKGHFEAASYLASRNFITEVDIIISNKVIDGITPEDSLLIWNSYISAEPNAKFKVQISTQNSPIVDIINFLKANPEISPVYVAGGDDESDDQEYLISLRDQFGDRIKPMAIHEKEGKVSAPYIRDVLRKKDFEAFKKVVPEAAANRGVALKIFKMLSSKIVNEPTV
jgi:hypothetical protein